jgi:dihydroorotase-like cyclic amidohydrolase
VVNNDKFYSKGKSTPFNNKVCYGKIKYTIVNGVVVYPF